MPAEVLTTLQKILAKQHFCWHSLSYSSFLHLSKDFYVRVNSVELFCITKYSSGQACKKTRVLSSFPCQPLPAVPSPCSALPAPITVLMGCTVLTLLVCSSFVTLAIVFLVITYTLIAKHNFQGVKLKLQSAPMRNTYLCLEAPCECKCPDV